jgi:hypothetical protein
VDQDKTAGRQGGDQQEGGKVTGQAPAEAGPGRSVRTGLQGRISISTSVAVYGQLL